MNLATLFFKRCKMKAKIFSLLVVLVLSFSVVFAHEEENFTETKEIIAKQTPCSELTEEQLEKIGDYYMEQMHPGEAHEAMDKMMGGEGSAQLKQMHLNMAKNLYCRDGSAMPMGMMSMMSSNMMQEQGGMMKTQKYMQISPWMMGGSGGMMGYGSGFSHYLVYLSSINNNNFSFDNFLALECCSKSKEKKIKFGEKDELQLQKASRITLRRSSCKNERVSC